MNHPELSDEAYDELYRVARRLMLTEVTDAGHDVTDVLHEAYLRCFRSDPELLRCSHAKEIAARTIRRVLVDHARTRGTLKRGAAWHRTTLTEHMLALHMPPVDLLELEEVLDRFSSQYPVQARVVNLRFFGCYTAREIAEVLDLPERRVRSHWDFSRAWLRTQLQEVGAE